MPTLHCQLSMRLLSLLSLHQRCIVALVIAVLSVSHAILSCIRSNAQVSSSRYRTQDIIRCIRCMWNAAYAAQLFVEIAHTNFSTALLMSPPKQKQKQQQAQLWQGSGKVVHISSASISHIPALINLLRTAYITWHFQHVWFDNSCKVIGTIAVKSLVFIPR